MYKTDIATYLPSPVTIPPAGGTFIDGMSGVTILRFTDERDGEDFGTTYSVWPTFNRDNTKLWIFNSKTNNYWVGTMNAAGERVGPLALVPSPPAKLFTHQESSFWSFLDADKAFVVVDAKIYYYRPSTRSYTLVKDLTTHFPANYFFVQLYVSRDDNRFAALVRLRDGGDQGFMVYELSTDTVKLDVRSTDVNGITMLKSGSHVLLVPQTDPNQYVYNVDTGAKETLVSDRFTGKPDYLLGHCDSGVEIVVGMDQWRGGVTTRKLAEPHVIQLPFTHAPYWISNHVSLLADNENWALLSTYGKIIVPEGLDTNRFKDECFQVGTQGEYAGKIRRLFHHRGKLDESSFDRTYWSTPRATISRDGRLVAFTSNASGQNHLYVARIEPAVGDGVVPQPLPTQPVPPPLPAPSPDSTKGTTVIDSTGAIWTFGFEGQTLRNNTHMGRGAGSVYKYVAGVVYVLGTDASWYRWVESWVFVGKVEPGVVLPPPEPIPTPVPTPTPVPPPPPPPTPPPLRTITYPKQVAKRNTILETQRKERFYLFKEHDNGTATFEKVP